MEDKPMALFHKKTATSPVVLANSEIAASDHSFQTCYHHLNELFISDSHRQKGVVLKVYLDLAAAKAAEYGINQYAMYDMEIHNQSLRRQRIALSLQSALEKKEIEVRFRPTCHSASGRFTRAEFYMRIFIEGLGMVGSAQFLPLAEDFGQIHAIEAFALDQVGHCISRLMEGGKEFESIALPISSLVLLLEDFLDEVQAVIDKYHIPPKNWPWKSRKLLSPPLS